MLLLNQLWPAIINCCQYCCYVTKITSPVQLDNLHWDMQHNSHSHNHAVVTCLCWHYNYHLPSILQHYHSTWCHGHLEGQQGHSWQNGLKTAWACHENLVWRPSQVLPETNRQHCLHLHINRNININHNGLTLWIFVQTVNFSTVTVY